MQVSIMLSYRNPSLSKLCGESFICKASNTFD